MQTRTGQEHHVVNSIKIPEFTLFGKYLKDGYASPDLKVIHDFSTIGEISLDKDSVLNNSGKNDSINLSVERAIDINSRVESLVDEGLFGSSTANLNIRTTSTNTINVDGKIFSMEDVNLVTNDSIKANLEAWGKNHSKGGGSEAGVHGNLNITNYINVGEEANIVARRNINIIVNESAKNIDVYSKETRPVLKDSEIDEDANRYEVYDFYTFDPTAEDIETYDLIEGGEKIPIEGKDDEYETIDVYLYDHVKGKWSDTPTTIFKYKEGTGQKKQATGPYGPIWRGTVTTKVADVSVGSDRKVTINGSILAGALGQLDIRIGGDGSELYDGVNPRLEVRNFITGQWEDWDYSKLGLAIEDGVISVPDLKAETGSISITSSSLTGSGTLQSKGGKRISIDNNTNADIEFNSVIIDGNGSGEVTWNGQGPNNNGIIGSSGSSINVLSDGDLGGDSREGIYLTNNWRKIYHDNKGSDIDVLGTLENKNGLVEIINKSGNVSVGDIDAKNINVEVWHGNYDQVAMTDLTLSEDSYIVASGDINIRANSITNDGIIQSGFAKYEAIDDGSWDKKDGNSLTDEQTAKYNQYRLNEGGIFKDQDGTYKYIVQVYYNPAGHAFTEDIVSHGGNVAIDGNLSGTGKVVALDGMADVTIKNNVRALFKLNRIEVENIDGNVTVNNNEEQIKYIRNDASTIDVTASGDIELLNNIIGDRRNNAESEINIQSKNGSIAQIDGDIVSDKLMLSANNRIHFNKIGVGSLLSMIGNELSLDYAWQLPNRSNMVKVKLKSVGDITPINNVNFKYLDIANGVILERLWANNAFVHVQAEKFYIPQVKITEEGNFSNKHAKAKIYGSGPRRDPDMDFMVWNDRRWFSPRIDFYFLGGKVVDSNALLFYNRDYYRIFKGMLQSYINERFDALSTRDSYQDRRVVDDVVIDLSDEGVQKEEE